MNSLQMRAHAMRSGMGGGFGELGFDSNGNPTTLQELYGVLGPPPVMGAPSGTGHSTRDAWLNFGSTIAQSLASIVSGGNNQMVTLSNGQRVTMAQYQQMLQAQAQAQYQYQGNPNAYGYPSGVGFGIDGQGLRLSDGSHIGWTTIAIAGVGLYLLQRPGYQKRR